MLYFIEESGRKHPGELRICPSCKKEKTLRKDRKKGHCRECIKARKSSLDECYLLDSRGNRCAAVIRKCLGCGEEKKVRKAVSTAYCKKCIQSRKKSCISDKDPHYIDEKGAKVRLQEKKCEVCGEISLIQKREYHSKLCKKCAANNRETAIPFDEKIKNINRNRRGVKSKCSKCGEQRLIRIGKENSTGMCDKCYREDRYTGIGKYKDIAYEIFKKQCVICEESEKRIEVHHIDQDRNNNDISNLLPLCTSCHRYIHSQLRSGKSHDEAYLEVKKIKSV